MPRPDRAAAVLAAALATAALCAGDVLARSYPFGPRTRSVNDLGNQYVPFHAHLWDLLHGRADGGLLVDWQSGYGSSFLPDLGTYLGSPFAPLVALFPRDEIDLAVYVITLLKIACAAAAMAWLLLTLRPGRWWAAGLLGASYALCGWTLADADYNPMWLDGLIAFPLLCLVGERALTGRRRLPGVLIVALAWTANFYTAYMATLGAALVLLLRLLLDRPPLRRALATAGRAALTTALGVGLAAPLVTVVYFGTRHAHPGRERRFSPVPAEDVLARLLPTTYGFGSPALYVGVTALLLALALPFHRAVPGRVRAGWTALVLAVALSLQWEPTHLLWHAFATPQGSAYRQTFVLCGLLVVAAWQALSHGPPDRRALGAATALLVLITALASRSGLVRIFTWPVLLLAVAGAVGGLVLLARSAPRGRPAALAVVLLLGAQLGETAATSAVAGRMRLGHMDDYAPWGERQERQAALIAEADGWPRYRADPGREQTVGNDPMLVGGQGAQYYSSLTSDVLSRTLTALGDGWTSRGRSVQSLDNAVTDVIFSVGARVHSPPDPHQKHVPPGGTPATLTRRGVPPLVTVRPVPDRRPFGPSPYRNQEILLGSRVYTVPRTAVQDDAGKPVPSRRVGSGNALSGPTVTARCPAGSQVYLWAPHYAGTARLAGTATGTGAVFRFEHPRNRAAMAPLGTAPDSGRLRIRLTPKLPGRIPPGAIGCLDTARLRTAAAHLTSGGATHVSVSDGTVRAVLPAGSKGTAVVAVPRIAGWRCATGDRPARPAGEYHGLVAVPLDAASTSLTCTFHPPGLRLGTTVGAASLLTLVVLTALTAVRRRRVPASPTTTSPRERETAAL
ncbi:YfhO family protein [Streptomyces actinomycinicus]|uniref:YfhO family protein n=1 Tax=Streptomyces actinomycinicus TaxID=1695166 RepID=A0A937JQE1_9ACTN|nr:YfhO family protein [Streptomyces actinomycinicus]MBL1085301.1 YfhO family protein [Streptomyces actinomycinicus]